MTGRLRDTLVGGTAVVMWGALALLTTLTGQVPPFLLIAMCFTVATLLGIAKWVWRHENPLPYLLLPPRVWLLGIAGLFGYHFFYFMALRNAPAVEASLIAYLWPLLIVLFSSLLPGGGLRWWHLLGAFMGLAGCALLITDGGRIVFREAYAVGYAAAAACAIIWAVYSVASRRVGAVPSDIVTGYCAVSALLGFLCHRLFEETLWPASGVEWLAVLLLGLGPVGAAFFAWDRGVKRGDIRALGGFAYSAPLISTLLLIAFGKAEPSWVVAIACLAIVGGALLAARDLLFQKRVEAEV